ncbi:MAG TPA: phosphomethylpyrimidine synthase ThiC [Candidatus Omnitrophota bacterium]|nr:phosphomethylpyrimidine synthase ThiC [Candidatus Omnitrophota bacterium]
MTQLQLARSGKITDLVKNISRSENIPPETIVKGLAEGHIVIPNNRLRKIAQPCAIGKGLSTKINANIGTSKDSSNIQLELQKMRIAIDLGSDTVMDLSTGPKFIETRRAILKSCKVPVGTVPIYEIMINSAVRHKNITDTSVEEMFQALESQAKDGVDFFTIHAGVTKNVLDALQKSRRVLDIVSRGGAFLAQWMIANGCENPFYQYFERVIDIAYRYDITLSLGDGLRPGSIADATDRPQIMELITLGELRNQAVARGVQVMIEGPGHVPLDQVETNVVLEKVICSGAPFYVLGPLVTDIAPGYDHITAAIGGAVAAAKGADFLCYVTPAEHLRLPTLDDVKDGVIASKIAAHAADIVKGVPKAKQRDIDISRARKARDWESQFTMALDSEKPRRYRKASRPGKKDVCTMCGEYCSIKISSSCIKR